MTTPQEFDSFRMGANLTSANYSGGAGGTCDDLVQGADFWTVNGATPVFETRAGMEGMIFAGDITESVVAPMLALHEATILCIAEADAATDGAFYGGTNAAANQFYGSLFSNKLFTFASPSGSAQSAADVSASTQPTVFTSSWHPESGTMYSQINDGAVATHVKTGVNAKTARIGWAEVAIGRDRTLLLDGWVGRILVFDRALHARGNDNLQLLIETEMASVGL